MNLFLKISLQTKIVLFIPLLSWLYNKFNEYFRHKEKNTSPLIMSHHFFAPKKIREKFRVYTRQNALASSLQTHQKSCRHKYKNICQVICTHRRVRREKKNGQKSFLSLPYVTRQ